MVEQYANAYYHQIEICNDLSKLESLLPNKQIPDFEKIMDIVIKKLWVTVDSLYELLDEKTSSEEELLEEIQQIKLKIICCENYLNPIKKEENHIIFATSETGQILPLSDIENINDEYYMAILNLLDKLQKEVKTNNHKKKKTLTNNKTVKGVKEVKDNKVRILYKNIKGNVFYVFLIMIKKDDWSKRDDNKVDSRLKNVQRDFDYIESLDDDELKRILDSHGAIYMDIKEVLSPPDKEKSEEFKVEELDKQIHKNRYDRSEEFKQLDPNWKFYYNIANKVKKLEGTINVKTVYRYNDVEIGHWLKQQKDAYDKGMLLPIQISLLEKLGIKWHAPKQDVEVLTLDVPKEEKTSTKRLSKIPAVKNKLEERWFIYYNLARQFFEQYGHLRIPVVYTIDGVSLGHWIDYQRQKYKKGKMSLEKIKLLEDIGMLWEVYKPREKAKIGREKQVSDFIINIYQNLYNMTQDEAEEFILRIENDSEGIHEISKRQK